MAPQKDGHPAGCLPSSLASAYGTMLLPLTGIEQQWEPIVLVAVAPSEGKPAAAGAALCQEEGTCGWWGLLVQEGVLAPVGVIRESCS